MTIGSYSPSGVVNAAFQQSSFFILTVLYPHQSPDVHGSEEGATAKAVNLLWD